MHEFMWTDLRVNFGQQGPNFGPTWTLTSNNLALAQNGPTWSNGPKLRHFERDLEFHVTFHRMASI